MANSTSDTQKVEELLDLYKETTVVLKGVANKQFLVNQSVVDAIFSPVTTIRKSKRLVEKCKTTCPMAEILSHVGEGINNRKGYTAVLTKKIPSLEEIKSYAEQDLFEIHTQVIKVDLVEEDGEDTSSINLNKINENYEMSKKRSKVKFEHLQSKKEIVKASKQIKYKENHSSTNTNITNKSKTPRIHVRTRPVKDNKTIIEHEKKSNASTTKNSTTRCSTRVKKQIRSCLNDEEDSSDYENTSNVLSSKNIKNKSSTRAKTHSHSGSKKEKDSKAKTPNRIPCAACDKSFKFLSDLKAHDLSHTGYKPHKCHLCPSRFGQKQHLKRHMLSHSTKKMFKCGSCRKSFHRKYYLLVHLRVHSGDKPYSCEECNTSFAQKSGLNTHMKSHQERQFKCDHCKQSFVLRHHMANHIKLFHKNC